MSHASTNFKTKKALREAVARGEQVSVFNPSGMFPDPKEGTDVIEGPWEFHRWYASVELKDGVVVRVK